MDPITFCLVAAGLIKAGVDGSIGPKKVDPPPPQPPSPEEETARYERAVAKAQESMDKDIAFASENHQARGGPYWWK